MVQVEDMSAQEAEIGALLRSIICLQGKDGLPLRDVQEEFRVYVGHPIPYEKFGFSTLRDFVATLPDVYIVKDSLDNEVLIEQSKKSAHLKELILKQKKNPKRKPQIAFDSQTSINLIRAKRPKNYCPRDLVPEGAFYHTCINNNVSVTQSDRFNQFEQLESILPLFYNHQALGDEFFLDIADTKYGYYVPENGPKKCGLVECGSTIKSLTEKIKAAEYIAPRVVVMIGFNDLIMDSSVNQMITDFRHLIRELKRRDTRITLLTLIPSPKLPNSARLQRKMEFFNLAIMEYITDSEFQCNVIDMNMIFENEAQAFNRDFDRFIKVVKKDPYKVFSDYGRKTFLAALRKCLREQIEAGH